MKLIIGNKNYSSWSLRPWLVLKVFDIEFDEETVSLFTPDMKDVLLGFSPSGKVPVLEHNDVTIWDSMAICEYIADLHPEKAFWPLNREERALAHSVSNEMHSGFFSLRETLPLNCRASIPQEKIDDATQADIDRICAIWTDCCTKFANKGPFLFGDFTIADAMFAPVVLRFKTYHIEVSEPCQQYMETILHMREIKQWLTDSRAEQGQIVEPD